MGFCYRRLLNLYLQLIAVSKFIIYRWYQGLLSTDDFKVYYLQMISKFIIYSWIFYNLFENYGSKLGVVLFGTPCILYLVIHGNAVLWKCTLNFVIHVYPVSGKCTLNLVIHSNAVLWKCTLNFLIHVRLSGIMEMYIKLLDSRLPGIMELYIKPCDSR